MKSLKPKRANFSSIFIFWECLHLLFTKSIRSFQNDFTISHCHSRCRIVSLSLLQNWQRWLCSLSYFETDLFVVRTLWTILYCNHLNFVSGVVFFNRLKLPSHSSSVNKVELIHFVLPLHSRKFESSSLYIVEHKQGP